MSEVYIHYGNLEDSIEQSQKVRSEISGYIEEIKRRVTTPISRLSGSDSAGYISTASNLAWQKINDLSTKASRYSFYENSIRNLISTAKNKDRFVSSQIETISDLYLTERNWLHKAGDAIYNFFCVDLANKWEWTRTIADVSKWTRDKIDNVTDKLRDWFKYGDGKYWANIGDALLGAITAVASVIIAVVTLPVTGTAAIIIGVVSLVLATVTMVITFYNTESTVKANKKALDLSRDGHPGAARYYGNIDSLSDEWKKTDMGDAETNKRYERAGKTIDTIKKVADTGQIVCNVLNLGVVKDFRFREGYGNADKLSFKFSNIKRNILHDMKIYTSKIGKKGVKWHEKVNWGKAINLDSWFGGYSPSKFKIDNKFVIPEGMYHFFNAAKTIKNSNGTVEKFFEVGEALEAEKFVLGDFLDPTSKLTSVFTPIGKPMKYVTDIIDDVDGWKKWTQNVFTTPEEADIETISGWFDDAFEGTAFESPPSGWSRIPV